MFSKVRIILTAVLSAALVSLVVSCGKDASTDEKETSGVSFTEFSLSDGKAVYEAWKFSRDGVYVSVPEGTDLTKLTASFAHDGLTVSVNGVEQQSGKNIRDFSNFTRPVSYQVNSSLGSSWTYPILIFTLPVMEINTPKNVEIKDKVTWIEGTTLTVHYPDGTCSTPMRMSVKGRGNATWSSYPKKPYAIRMDERTEFFGLPEHKRWILLAEYRGFIGNPMEAEMERRTESIDWCPSGEFVELVLNGVHKGLYYFCEQIKIDKNRIKIKQLDSKDTEPEKFTGGYLLEYDNLYDEPYKFRSEFFKDTDGNMLPIMLKSPDEDVPDCQFNYIKNYIHDFEEALHDDARLATREYAEYVDIDSFIDCWFVWETVGNYEAFKPRSVYMHKGRDGKDSPEGTVAKLKCGPLWDQEIFHVNKEFSTINAWYYKQFFKDPVFVARVKEKWLVYQSNLKGNDKYPASIYKYLQNMYDHIHNSAERDLNMWKNEYFTLDADVEKVMQKLPAKLSWMDQQIRSMGE